MVLLYILLGFGITKLAQVSTEKVSGIKYLRLKTFERGRRGWRKEFPLQYHRDPFGEEGIRDVQVFLIYSGDKWKHKFISVVKMDIVRKFWCSSSQSGHHFRKSDHNWWGNFKDTIFLSTLFGISQNTPKCLSNEKLIRKVEICFQNNDLLWQVISVIHRRASWATLHLLDLILIEQIP